MGNCTSWHLFEDQVAGLNLALGGVSAGMLEALFEPFREWESDIEICDGFEEIDGISSGEYIAMRLIPDFNPEDFHANQDDELEEWYDHREFVVNLIVYWFMRTSKWREEVEKWKR
jgi:hypothetical protein